MAAKKDTLINMFVALFVICIVSGGVLGVVYNATKDPIAAAEAAKEGDVVLMSPASAAFDQFKNFMVRGDFYKKLVMEL